MKKRILVFCVILSLSFLMYNCQEQSETEQDTAIPVKVEAVALGELVQTLHYSSDIEAEFEVKVFSKIPDRIEKFYVDDGDYLKKGDPIARIYATTIEQGVRQAEAGLVAAKAQTANATVEYERANRLFQENAMSKQQYDMIKTQFEAAKAGLEQAESAVKTANSMYSDATVAAPISGIVGKRYYEEGDMANPAMPLVTIVQMNKVKIIFDAAEQDLGRLKPGQEARVYVKSYPDEYFKGRVIKISPILDPLTRMAEVEVMVNNADGRLKPGMFGSVDVIVGKLSDVIVVPRYAVIEHTTLERIGNQDEIVKNYYVFVTVDSTAFQKKLDVEYVNHVAVAVRDGIDVGDNLVIQGQNALRDSIKVIVVKEDQSL
ncbi:efflux RND transporter periplasmic adaptor subunit [candidate division KSB1 bacterium]|nr:efflux RND transporter periplasmic adaptor subunit [candidate division KSB1 bacterium]